jgi:hypothetical protein
MENRKQRPSLAGKSGGRWTEATAKGLLDEWASSEEPMAVFARRLGVSAQRLAWWMKRLGHAGRTQSMATGSRATIPAFVPVTVRAASVAIEREPMAAVIDFGAAMRVELRTLDGASAEWVAMLARALGVAS